MTQHVADSAKIGQGVFLGKNVVILESVEIGANTYVGHSTVIHEGTRIGHDVHIEDGCILGRMPRSGARSLRKASQELPPLQIGHSCVVGANVILYRGTMVGNEVLIGDLASVREKVTVGNRTIVGRLVMVEPNTTIGNHVVIQTGTDIGGDAIIEDDVYMGRDISTTNDNNMGRGTVEFKGCHIKKAARVGSNATLLPGVVLGEECIVAAGSVVTKDVPPYKVAMGVPARVVKDVPREDTT